MTIMFGLPNKNFRGGGGSSHVKLVRRAPSMPDRGAGGERRVSSHGAEALRVSGMFGRRCRSLLPHITDGLMS